MSKARIVPTPIKFTPTQKKYLKREARRQGHGHLSKVVKGLVDRDMASSVEVPK